MANGLRVLADTAASTATLNSGNNVATLAASMSGAGSTLNYRDGDALSVGSVTSVAVPGNATTTTNGISVAGDVTLTSGALSEAGTNFIGGSVLTTNTAGGATLNNANTVNTFNALNTISGDIALINTANPLTITGISNTGGGSDTVNNAGALSITGTIGAAAAAR